MLRLQLLPARQGDAIWIQWGERKLTHQMLVDMGTNEIGNDLFARLANKGEFELLVVTHIDSDHIGGVISCLVNRAQAIAGTTFKDVWFNGLEHTRKPTRRKVSRLEPEGPLQGLQLGAWLKKQRWNMRFGGGPVMCGPRSSAIPFPGGLKLTILGPTRARLEELRPVWSDELIEAFAARQQDAQQEAPSGLEVLGARQRPRKPVLQTASDLDSLAGKVTGADDSRANGSSIVLLLEHGDNAVLLAGDAYAGDLVASIKALKRKTPFRLDAFKLPHHGSRKNMTAELIRAVECPRFLFSTDGTQFFHPDADAVACVIANAKRAAGTPVCVGFNYRSEFTGWWNNPAWTTAFDYRTEYGNKADGLIVDLVSRQRARKPARTPKRRASRR